MAAAVLGPVIAGGIGGWISTLLTTRAARRRQRNDHEHARRLAAMQAEVDTAAALRTERLTLYSDLMEVMARLHNSARDLSLACLGRWAPKFDERRRRLEEVTEGYATARRDLWELLPRINLIAGAPIRESFLAVNNLMDELALSAFPLCGGGSWDEDEDNTEREAVREWWRANRVQLQTLSDQLHEAMREDVQKPPVLQPADAEPAGLASRWWPPRGRTPIPRHATK